MSRRDKPRRWKSGSPPPDPFVGLNALERLQLTIRMADKSLDSDVILGLGGGYRSNDPCAYCGWPADSWDHIEPVGRGGSAASSANVTRACKSCNMKKGNLSLLKFFVFKDIRGSHPVLVRQRKLWILLSLIKQFKQQKQLQSKLLR